MSTNLHWDARSDGAHLRVDGPDGALPLKDWSSVAEIRLGSGAPAHLGPVLRLIEESQAVEVDSATVLLPWDAVAGLSDRQLAGLGLPPRGDVSIALRSYGGLTDPEFRVQYHFINSDGIPLSAVQRQGALLTIGDRRRTLPEPIYGIVEDLDRLSDTPPSGSSAQRMEAWGRIADRLPEDVAVEGSLDGFHFRLIDAFELRPQLNEHGEPDFDAVPGRFRCEEDETGELRRVFRTDLPPGRVEEFAKRFRGLRVKRNQSLGGNTFAVLTPAVQAALEAAQEVRSGSPEQRTEFLRRPATVLRQGLERAGLDVEVDEVFSEEGWSDRVLGIGLWKPKVLPWFRRSSAEWLPPEPVGLLGDSVQVAIPQEDIPAVLEELEKARHEGRAAVRYGDHSLPATEETARILRDQLRGIEPSRQESEPGGTRQKKILEIEENLEAVTYQTERRARTGAIGRTPEGLTSHLLPHQTTGLEWLQRRWLQGASGALLADDMGLGKTLQALAFLAWVRGASGGGPLLVVAPTGLLANWIDEHAKHLTEPGLGEPLPAFGPGLKKLRSSKGRELELGRPLLDCEQLRESPWTLTTYETLRDYQHSFARVRWTAAVFDEAQKIKNPAASVTDAALAMNIDFSLLMTGTPVENRPADVWPLLDRAQPGDFGSLRDFRSAYEDDSSDAPLLELNKRLLRQNDAGGAPVLLRRMKEDHVKGLPPKQVLEHPVAMPQAQADIYRQVVERAHEGRDMLAALQALRAVSLHPHSELEGDIDEVISSSARLAETFRILDEVGAAGEKALVFCESLEMQDFLAEALPRKFRLPGPVAIINGQIAGSRRQERVKEFQHRMGFDVFVLSPRAGGVGLTLTAANHVIHLSRWWNPAVEDQCSDRVYRIGQRRPVTVHLPIARHPVYQEHSFDVRLNELLHAKRVQNQEVLAPIATTRRDLEDLYRGVFEANVPIAETTANE